MSLVRTSGGLAVVGDQEGENETMTRADRARARSVLGLALTVLVWLGACSGAGGGLGPAPWAQPPDPSLAPYVVTPQEVVDEMLRLAGVGKDDLVYDLGSGDGRIVITAARLYGARGVGFELDPELVRRARENARRANVSDRVEFRQQDVMTVDLSPATVLTLYLSREANLRLRPHILTQVRPGGRVVSHEFDMGDWRPSAIHRVRDEAGGFRTLYLWPIASSRPGGEGKGSSHP